MNHRQGDGCEHSMRMVGLCAIKKRLRLRFYTPNASTYQTGHRFVKLKEFLGEGGFAGNDDSNLEDTVQR